MAARLEWGEGIGDWVIKVKGLRSIKLVVRKLSWGCVKYRIGNRVNNIPITIVSGGY